MATLYLIQHENIPEYTKIGFSRDFNKRLKQLSTASPTGIHIVYTVETSHAYRLEQALHRKYAKQRTNLEWFALSREDIVDIIFWVEDLLSRR